MFHPKATGYISHAKSWQTEMKELRRILLACGLTEDFKWGKPCYTFEDANVVMIIAFKNYCALSFLKGSLLNDPDGILISPGENSQAARQIRFTDTKEIVKAEDTIKAYVKEAIAAEKEGLKVAFTEKTELKLPEELQTKLDEMPELKTAFEALTPGRQRAYVLYFSSAKQAETREARIKKYIPQMLEGKGMQD